MKYIFIALLTAQLSIADSTCILTYNKSNLSLSDKKVCCTMIKSKDIDLDTRGRNGWYRFTIRNNWTVNEREEFMKCLDSYFDSERETRIGGSL